MEWVDEAAIRLMAEKLEISLVYLPPYSPDLNPIEFIWKGIKRVVSISFVENVEVLREIIEKAFRSLAKRLSFAKSWIRKFVSSWI
jgi:transposase